MYQITALDAQQARRYLDSLVAVLEDAVASGASVGFLPPLDAAEARDYWAQVIEAVAAGHRILLAAIHDDQCIGAAQLDLARMPNGRHRAEVMKLLVHSSARRQGIGRALMTEIENAARSAGRTLLVLDTKRGDAAEQLYHRLGYIPAGIIPGYALNSTGHPHDTVFFYKSL